MREAFHFHCPNCSAPLRVKDPLSLGRQTHCPDCHHALLIVDENGTPRITLGAPAAKPASAPQPAAGGPDSARSSDDGRAEPNVATAESRERGKGHSRARRERRAPKGRAPRPSSFWNSKPLLAGWVLVAIASAVFVRMAFFSGGQTSEGVTPVVSNSADHGAVSGEDPSDADDDDHEGVAADTTEHSLGDVSRQLQQYLALEGAFPAGTVASSGDAVEQRLSWLAVLADRMPAHPPVHWDNPWNDSLNDGFVRRRILEFQNPAIPVLIGTDGYPATHFVGVGGVGLDATRLEASDPRAGIFADDRQTRLEDIRDGASNTWLVLGVQERLGSWAAGGHSTVRSLTQEPYVNGRDGFGTGQADSMLVLLADGRVQAVSAAADPNVLRSLATIADGRPVSEDEPDDPTVGNVEIVSSLEENDRDDGMQASMDDPPLDPEFGPEPAVRKIDPAITLQQPIVRFELSPARPLADLLPGLAELVGVPLRFDPEGGITASSLKTPIQLQLQETTVGAILEGALKQAGLTYQIESDHLRIVPRE